MLQQLYRFFKGKFVIDILLQKGIYLPDLADRIVNLRIAPRLISANIDQILCLIIGCHDILQFAGQLLMLPCCDLAHTS